MRLVGFYFQMIDGWYVALMDDEIEILGTSGIYNCILNVLVER